MLSRLILMKQICASLRSSWQAQRGSFDLSPGCLHFNLRSLHFMLAPATRIEVTLKSYTHGTFKLYGFCRSVLTCLFLGVITYMQPQSSPLTKMKTRLSEPTVLESAFSLYLRDVLGTFTLNFLLLLHNKEVEKLRCKLSSYM